MPSDGIIPMVVSRTPRDAGRAGAGNQPGAADVRPGRQRRQHLGLGSAQRTGPHPREAVANGQVGYYLGEQGPQRGGRLGSQPNYLVTEPARASETAVEAGHGRPRQLLASQRFQVVYAVGARSSRTDGLTGRPAGFSRRPVRFLGLCLSTAPRS